MKNDYEIEIEFSKETYEEVYGCFGLIESSKFDGYIFNNKEDARDYYDKYYSNDDKYKKSDVWVDESYGHYNGSYVVEMGYTGGGIGWTVITPVNIGGITLNFPTTNIPFVWDKCNFYTLEEAYDN